MAQQPILIACALKKECARLCQRFSADSAEAQTRQIGPLRFRHTGMGPDRAAERLAEIVREENPRRLIFTGTAGGLDPSLEMGQVILPRAWILEDGSRFDNGALGFPAKLPGDPLLQVELGLTVRRPVLRPSARRRLHRDTGAAICDMESAAVLRTAARLSVPALALKVVSDTGSSGIADFWKHFDANLEHLSQALENLLADLA
ncbi:MAG TPA: hypothetical protein VLV83_12030 [Acidobacteriota bacterium]|nr:hypothetical protein [Acidobacteriota bacterium]